MMTKFFKFQAILLILGGCIFSCSNKMNVDKEGLEEVVTAKFYVSDAYDTCGCFLLFCDKGGTGLFHDCFVTPENLPKKYQKDRLHINVAFRYTGVYSGFSDENSSICSYPIIKIIKIEEL